jgi:hypothetical protein
MSEVTVLEALDNLIEEMKSEKKKVIRAGKQVIKHKCPPGTVLTKQGTCKLQTAAQRMSYKKAGIKRSKTTRRRNPAVLAKASKQRKKSMHAREMRGL